MACQIAMVPMMLDGLGGTDYGVWLTWQGVLGFIVFADFGVGNGAMNRISHALAKGDWATIRSVTSSALAMLTGAGLAVLSLALGGFAIFGQPDSAGLVFAIYFAAVLPVSFVERLLSAFQDGAIVGIARATASIVTLGVTWAAIVNDAPFPIVCIATLAPTIVFFAIAWWIARVRHPQLALALVAVSVPTVVALLTQGFWFFILQGCATLIWATDNLMITSILGPDVVPNYAVPQRLFAVVLLFTSTMMAPLWPAYADAEAHGDTAWMNRMLVRSFAMALAASAILSTAIAATMPWILRLWVGDQVVASRSLAWGLATMTTVYASGTALSMYLNGRSRIRIQVLLATLQTVLTLGLKAMFLKRQGIDCLPWITTIVYLGIAAIPTWFYLREAHMRSGMTVDPANSAGSIA